MMSCEQFREGMSPYIDGMLEGDEKIEFEAHLKSCLICRKEFEQFKAIMDEVHNLPEQKLPKDYHKDLMLKLYKAKETNKPKYKSFYTNWKVLSTLAASFILLIFVVGSLGNLPMGSSKTSESVGEARTGSSAPQAPMEMYDTAVTNQSAPGEVALKADVATQEEAQQLTGDTVLTKLKSSGVVDRKIIYNNFMSLEVETFDEVVAKIKNMTNDSGGYVENSSSYIYYSEPERDIYLKQGNIVIRIPVEKYGQMQEQLNSLGHLIHQEETSTNVTEEYIETESRIRMLEVEQDRLLEIMKKADKVEDLIKLEERLNVIRTDLEIYKSKIKNWDQLVSFSTFTIELKEVKEKEQIKATDPNLKTKISSSFIRSLNDLREGFERVTVAVAYRIVPFTIFVIICGIAFLLLKPLFKRILGKIHDW